MPAAGQLKGQLYRLYAIYLLSIDICRQRDCHINMIQPYAIGGGLKIQLSSPKRYYSFVSEPRFRDENTGAQEGGNGSCKSSEDDHTQTLPIDVFKNLSSFSDLEGRGLPRGGERREG
ncbi:hypothetical protein V6N12_004609 [Hibiscus sabdariffa]|uniref:Uncharacterized protein n=1 Tax=Hibiscus sabdariffa TaxID=183260 RepID=A0ABR2CLZ8_9ROSI